MISAYNEREIQCINKSERYKKMIEIAMPTMPTMPTINETVQNGAANATEPTEDSGFRDFYDSLVQAVDETQSAVDQDVYDVATGQVENLHDIMINSAKADLALYTMVSVRNAALESYNQIINMQI